MSVVREITTIRLLHLSLYKQNTILMVYAAGNSFADLTFINYIGNANNLQNTQLYFLALIKIAVQIYIYIYLPDGRCTPEPFRRRTKFYNAMAPSLLTIEL